jgi:hypothetical protein
MTQEMAATPDHAPLNAFVGAWDTEGEMSTDRPGHPVRFKATDSYEWLPGGHFLLHRFDANMPDGDVRGIEIIGYDQENKRYFMHSFDSSGNMGVMQAHVEHDTWRFVGEYMRFTGGFRENGNAFAGLWELRSSNGSTWRPWMNVILQRTR